MAPSYRLVMRSGKTEGTAYPLEKSEIFLGRDAANDIVINDAEVSRRHVRIFLQGPNYVIEDLGSTNGTSVNGQRLMGPYMLHPGEMITFGEHVNLLYEMVSASDATMVPPSAFQQPPVQQPYVQQPSMTPPPMYEPPPSYQQQPSAPIYTGQVPEPPEYEEPKKKFPTWLIILLIAILLMVCVCGLVLFFMPTSWWCALGSGWIFPADVCPP